MYEEWKSKREEMKWCTGCGLFRFNGRECEGCMDNAEELKRRMGRFRKTERRWVKRSEMGMRRLAFRRGEGDEVGGGGGETVGGGGWWFGG